MITPVEAFSCGTRSQGISQFYLHTPRSFTDRMNHTCPCFPSRSWYSLAVVNVEGGAKLKVYVMNNAVNRRLSYICMAKKAKKKEKGPQRFDKSHICPDHPRCATSTKVVTWGGVPDVVNYAKFHQNRFRGFGSPRDRNAMLSAMACITG